MFLIPLHESVETQVSKNFLNGQKILQFHVEVARIIFPQKYEIMLFQRVNKILTQ